MGPVAVNTLLIDKFQTLWAGTWECGIRRFVVSDRQNVRFLSSINEDLVSKKGLKTNSINVLYEGPDPNEDLVWIGTHNAGAHLYSRSKNSFRQWLTLRDPAQSSASNLVFSVCTDRHGALWIGSYEGLVRIDRKTGVTRRFRHQPADPHSLQNDVVNTILETSDGTLWAGTGGGLHRFDRARNRFDFVRLGNATAPQDYSKKGGTTDRVFTLYEDTRHKLWVGTA